MAFSNCYAFNNRGFAYAGLKQFKKAIQDYNQAIELDPEYTHAFNNRGLIQWLGCNLGWLFQIVLT
jgi:Flp pilus assembly protein TadD